MWYPWYPKIKKDVGIFKEFLKRFHIYAEVLHNAAWLGDEPGGIGVRETDYRIGLGFSTGGFFRD